MTITQSSTRLVTVAVGIAVAFSLIVGVFAAATPARAASLTAAQVQAIVSLLQSFGADAATIANVQASLNGQATPGNNPNTGTCPALSRSLSQGASGADVKALQVFLNGKSATQVSVSGAGSPGSESTFFGPATFAAVKKFQALNNVSPIGIVGPQTRAAIAAVCGNVVVNPGPNPSPVPITGNGLKVVLSPDSPNNVALVAGQAAGVIAKFTFVNPTNAAITVTNLSFKRIGVSNDSTMTNVYLYNGAVRVTDSAGVSNSAFNFNNSSGLFVVASGGSYTVSVESDIAAGTSGQQLGVQLVSVGATGTLDTNTSFPINSFTQSISAATPAAVDFNGSAPTPAVGNVDPQADYTVWQNTVNVSTRSVWLRAFALRNIGSIQTGDVRNFRLYVDGVHVGSAVAVIDSNNMVTFDLSANPANLQTGGRVVKVVADVVGGASRTFQFSLRYPADAIMVDSNLGQPVLPTVNSGSTFSARTTGVQTINSISNSAPSVTRASDSPTANVAVGGSNVKWASFKLLASGEDVKIDNLNVLADTSVHNGGLQNGAVFFNGVQVGSTKNLFTTNESTDTNFTFGSSMILKAGTVAVVDIYADAKTSSSTNLSNNETVLVSLDTGSSNGQGQISLSSVNIPTAAVNGNTLTVASSALTATKASGYGNQTMIAGSQNAKIGSFTLSTGSTEGVNVNTIEIKFAQAVTATISDLTLRAHNTGTVSDAMVGSSKSTIGTTNDFSVNETIPASGTKTYDVYANIKTSAIAGIIGGTTATNFTVDTGTTGTGATTGNSVSVAAAVQLQSITVGSALLTGAVDTGNTPDNANVIAGSNMVKIASFKFTAQYSPFTVDKIVVKIPSGAATSVGSVMLKYPDSTGAIQTTSGSNGGALALPTAPQNQATSTFTGLTFHVPSNDSRSVDVYVSIPTIASGATSGAGISALLDVNDGFNATDSAGNATTSFAQAVTAADLNGAATTGKGNAYVRKSIPTLSAVAIPTTVLSAGANKVLGRVMISADAAGDISWDKLVFTITKSNGTPAVTIGGTSTLALYDGANAVAGAFGTTTVIAASPGLSEAFSGSGSTGGILTFIPTSEQTVTAGSSRTYELRGTIGGIAAGYNYVSALIAHPSTSITTSDAATVGNVVSETTTTSSFTWSDRSSISPVHSTGSTSLDWTNDYLIKTLPLDLGTMLINN